ncbi:MAG: AmpG family muropeptide MFS transporter [Pseudomonadota bacterium]
MPVDPSQDKGLIAPQRTWGEAFRVYLHPRVLAMAFLGFSAGLPFLLVFSTLTAWMAKAEVEIATIGFVSWIGITYSVKFFWAPVVDQIRLPILTSLLGRRRAWMLLAQVGIVAGLLGMSFCDPTTDLARLVSFALLVAFSSATQDIVVDAYRIEAVDVDLQGAMSATYIFGYRVAILAAGAGALYVADFVSWPVAYQVMAALGGIGIITTLVIREPEANVKRRNLLAEPEVAAFRKGLPAGRVGDLSAWFYGAVTRPFMDFFQSYGLMAAAILLFVSLFRLSDITLGAMANPFYIDLGFDLTEIANVTKVFGLLMTLAGTFLGGLLVVRYGVMRPLLLGAVMVAVTNVLFAVLYHIGPDIRFLIVTVSADNISGGLATAAFIAYLSSLTNRAFTATQYALFSSLMTLPGKFLSGFSGVIVEATDFGTFFLYAAALGLPAILLCAYLMRVQGSSGPLVPEKKG